VQLPVQITKGLYSKRYRHLEAFGVHSCIRGFGHRSGPFTPRQAIPRPCFDLQLPANSFLVNRSQRPVASIQPTPVPFPELGVSLWLSRSDTVRCSQQIEPCLLCRQYSFRGEGITRGYPSGLETKVTRLLRISLLLGDHCSLDRYPFVCEPSETYLIESSSLSWFLPRAWVVSFSGA